MAEMIKFLTSLPHHGGPLTPVRRSFRIGPVADLPLDRPKQPDRADLPSRAAAAPPPCRSAALLLAATALAYLPALRGGFLWDDDAHVTKAALRSLRGLAQIWFTVGATQQYYPVLHTAFWIEHRLWGDAVLGYHLVNVLGHATAAFLLVLILRRVERIGPAKVEPVGPNAPGATRSTFVASTRSILDIPLLAGLIFALHPVSVESVAWISEQKNTLSTVFYLLAALVYFRWREGRMDAETKVGTGGPPVRAGRETSTERTDGRAARPSLYLLALFCFVLAVLSKSVTATLPAALLVVLWWRRGAISWKADVRPLLPWFVFGAAVGLFTAWVERAYIGAQGSDFNLSLVERCLLAGRVVCFYLGRLIWPTNLVFIYPRWTVDASAAWQYSFPLGLLAAIAALWLGRRRGRGPLAAALFFVGTLFPVLGFVNVYPFIFSFVADHFQYLAAMGIIVPLAWGLAVGLRMRSQGAFLSIVIAEGAIAVASIVLFRRGRWMRQKI